MRLTLFVVLVICSSAASAVREEPEEGPGPTAAGALQSGHPHDVNAIFPCDGKPCPVNAFDPWHENPRKANPNAKGPDGQPLGAGGSAGAAALAEQKAADAAKAAADKAAIKDAAAAAAETAKAEEEEKALGADASKAMAAAAEAGKKEGDAAAKKAEAAAEKAGKDAAKGGAGKGGSSGSGSGSGSGKSGSGKSGSGSSGSSGSKGSGSSGSKGGSGSKGSGSKGSGSKASGKGGKGKKDGKGKNGGKGGAGGCPGQTNVCSRKRRRCLNKCKKDERAKKAEKQEKKVEKKLEASLQKNVQKNACPCAQQAPAAQPAGCPCQAAAAAAAAAGTPAPTEAPAAKPTPKPTEASGPEYGKPTDDQRKTAAPPCPEGAFCKGARTQMQQVIVDNGGPDLAKDNRFQQEPDIADMQQETGGASLTMSQAEAEELDDNNEDSYDMGPADEEDEAAAPIDPAVDQEQTKELEQAVDDAVPADDDTDAQNEDDIADAEQEGDEDLADATDEDDMLLQFQLRLMGTFTKGAADSIEKCTTKCESRFSTCQKVQKLQKAKADAQAKCGK